MRDLGKCRITHTLCVRWWPGHGLPKAERWFSNTPSGEDQRNALLKKLINKRVRYETFTQAHIQNA